MIRPAVAALGLVLLLCAAPGAQAIDRANVPLKNWGGFALYRDAIYEDLERLVTAGLADRVVLNTRPLSRAEAARIVARAIANIRADGSGAYNRTDLGSVLDRLMAEFDAELRALGVRIPSSTAPEPGLLSFVPIDRGQIAIGYGSRDLSLLNSEGRRFQRGFNSSATFESRAQVGDFLTFYLQPEVTGNEEYTAARLVSGYVKLTLFNVELLVGRESVSWGPGYRGSLVFSNNAPPLDQIRLGSAEAFMLPWVGEYIGPTRFLAFLAQLEKNRDHRRAKLFGMRGSIAPIRFLELGASFGNMFDGDDPPTLKLSEYPQAIFGATTSDQNVAGAKFRNNVVLSVDGELRLDNVDRFYIPARDLRFYFEYGWDDTCCDTAFIPDLRASSAIVGLHLMGLLNEDRLDLRLEATTTSSLSFTHNQFTSGWWTRGEVLSHAVGTDGFDVFGRLSNRFTEDYEGGLSVYYSKLGNTVANANTPRERRFGGGLDLSLRIRDRTTLFFKTEVAQVDNRNFKPGEDGIDFLVRLELTRKFR